MASNHITVIGSSNMDLVSYLTRVPRIGETLMGQKFKTGFGGKGANQAVMAAKLGANVCMVGKVGEDTFGADMRSNFKEMGIDVQHLTSTSECATGVAPIFVTPDGQNSIVVIPGANNLLSPADVQAARAQIKQSRVVVCQLEVPVETTMEALRVAHEEQVLTIMNPAPAPSSPLPDEIYALSDIFCPNEIEAEQLTGIPVNSLDDAERAAKQLLTRGVRTVLITLGARGVLRLNADGCKHFPVDVVQAVDTSGAGDAFIGSLAYYLSNGVDIDAAIRRASQVATISVQRPGTQTSFPTRAELSAELLC
eukprot:TRINITY_DN2337_c0_g1_i5.p1 TRINITY_DN2337_c0_g1~~TRINITY_DN2337_c0_g1_i5.p1  ORF type:complete len:309 (-),score=60.44 TRINITY_DN2337_c0_g1_i5:2051-2977(-)